MPTNANNAPGAPELPAPERRLALLVSGLRHNFQEICAERLKEVGLSQGLVYFVLYVGAHEGCTQTEMNNALRVDVGYSTRSVSKLVEAGVIERAPNPADGRSNLLHLTQKGKEVSAFVEELVTEWDEEALSILQRNRSSSTCSDAWSSRWGRSASTGTSRIRQIY